MTSCSCLGLWGPEQRPKNEAMGGRQLYQDDGHLPFGLVAVVGVHIRWSLSVLAQQLQLCVGCYLLPNLAVGIGVLV